MPQIFVESQHGIETYTYPCDLPVWIMKKDFESKCPLHPRWVCHGKELSDDQLLNRELALSTVRVHYRLQGGDPFSRFISSMGKVFSFIIEIAKGVLFMVKALWCGITHLQNLWFCIFFYVVFFLYRFIAIAILVVYTIIDSVVEDQVGFKPCQWTVNLILEYTSGFIEVIGVLMPGVKTTWDKMMSCFIC